MDDWCRNEFSAISFGDKRVDERFIKVAQQIVGNPMRSISEACGTWAGAKAAYRMFDNDRISPSTIIETHRAKTIERARGKSVVLAVQDSSILNYEHFSSINDMGTVEGGNTWTHRGLILHPTIAVTPDGDCLGILDHIIYSRADGKRRLGHYDHLNIPISQKESYRWLRAMRAAHSAMGDQTTLVMVGDREADIFELFQEAAKIGANFLVRACKDRQLINDDLEIGNIGDALAAASLAGVADVEIKAAAKRQARIARVDIKFIEVTLKPPVRKRSARAEKLVPQTIWVVSVEENDPPKDTEALRWILLTNHPVENAKEAYEKLQWYKRRWTIETYFRTLKSGFRIESTRLNRQVKLERYIALVATLAIRVMNLANLRENAQGRQASERFSKLECEILRTKRDAREGAKRMTLYLDEAIREVAILGGFLARKNDGSAGATVIWRGLQRLSDLEQEWNLLEKLVGKP